MPGNYPTSQGLRPLTYNWQVQSDIRPQDGAHIPRLMTHRQLIKDRGVGGLSIPSTSSRPSGGRNQRKP
jgi:hypothetical protein